MDYDDPNENGEALLRHRYERELEEAPARFRRRLNAYALLVYGLAILLGALPLAVALSLTNLSFVGHFSAINVLLLLFAFTYWADTYRVGRALFSRDDCPSGVEINAADAPSLFSLVENVRNHLGAPAIDTIRIETSLNAAAAQRRPASVFGQWKNELILGLPLIAALPEEELMSVIAHEIGHFAGEHGRNRLHAQRALETFARVADAIWGVYFHAF